MTKSLVAILAFVMMSQAQAQVGAQMGQAGDAMTVQSLPQASKPAKRTMIYDERSNELVEVQPEVAQPQAQANPIYILNNQKYQGYAGAQAQQAQVQEQPTTVIQDSPLRASPADNMRRKRQDTEAATEDGIVQALERARMEDEIRRRDRFNSAIGDGAPAIAQPVIHQPVIQQPVIQQPIVQQVVPAPIAAPVVIEEEKSDYRSEVRASLRAREENDDAQSYYVSGLVGVSNYPDVINIRSNMAGGFALGTITPERFVAEGSFFFGRHEIEDLFVQTRDVWGRPVTRIVDMRQYNFSAALKYQLLPGRIRPVVGGLVSYTRRSYADQSFDFRTSDGVDAGVVAGLDMQLTDRLAIGVDFRYLMNIGYNHNTEGARNSFVYDQNIRTEVESLDYYMGSLTGKFTF